MDSPIQLFSDNISALYESSMFFFSNFYTKTSCIQFPQWLLPIILCPHLTFSNNERWSFQKKDVYSAIIFFFAF